jgi:signal peptide peptidase SppA
MTMLLHIAERVLNRPLLIHPDKVPLILSVLQGRLPIGDVDDLRSRAETNIAALPEAARAVMHGPLPEASRFAGDSADQTDGKWTALPYKRTADGVGIVTVTGSLINRGAFVGASSGQTSYEGIKFQLAALAADPKVKSVILDIESPGGEAVGAFEAAAAVSALAGVKPVVAVINGMAASAAYALASGASKIVTTPSGVSGSIGVVLMHADFSRALDKAGVTPTLIFAGAHKVDGNPYEPLPDAVRADLQREVEQYYSEFISTVAAGRRMAPDSIRATEARVYIGQEAVDAGLADETGTFESVLSDLSTNSRSVGAMTKGLAMSKTTSPAANAGNTGDNIVMDTVTASATAAPAASAPNLDAIAQAARQAERDRQKAILGSDEAKGRKKLAHHLAFETDLAAAQAVAILAQAPKNEEAPKSRLDAVMAVAAAPGLDGNGGGDGPGGVDHGAELSAACDRYIVRNFGKEYLQRQ